MGTGKATIRMYRARKRGADHIVGGKQAFSFAHVAARAFGPMGLARRRKSAERTSLFAWGNSLASASRCSRPLDRVRLSVAVRCKCEVQPVSGPVLVRMSIKRHDEATPVRVAELNGDIGRRQSALEQQRRTSVA